MAKFVPVAIIAATLLAGCTTTKQVSSIGFRPPQGSYKLVVMQPDVSVGELTAGGLFEQHQDWTETARANIIAALRQQQAARGGEITLLSGQPIANVDAATIADLERLHVAVGFSIRTFKYTALNLPTKKDQFNWTLGEEAVKFGTATGYDYALFLRAQDSFSSGGRVALQAVSLLGCVVGICLMPAGGEQAAFASLVDLKTGNIVWFNNLSSTVGDIRTEKGATEMIEKLVGQMKPMPDKKQKAPKS